ncbi:MAG: tetratricopeptide repeat protein [Saprospiraceae bacterium]|nr:tetratricopeptide repeat protein [Saprospiraceae bacterium]
MLPGNFFKVIVQGKFEFGNEKSYHKIIQLFEQKSEVLYKKELLFKTSEQLFVPENFSLTINRFIGTTSEKIWKNTISLLEYCAQFSVSGSLNAWMTDNGKIIQHVHIEPKGEKSSVMLYQEGKKLAEQTGKEMEAIQLLSDAIEKHNRHSQAYEIRGYVNYHLKNYEDALYDFRKSVNFDHMNASSHYGIGRTLMIKKDFASALENFDNAIKQSIALQPLHWAARRAKGNCHLELKEFEKAKFEFKLIVAKNFVESDPNFKHISKTWFNYGKTLFALGEVDAALDAFDKSLETNEQADLHITAEVFMHRGMARKAAGKADYILDLKKAAELGDASATLFLEQQA